MSGKNNSCSRTRDPQDLIAIFHCSFHPTRGNIIDWSMKASEGLSLDGVEFSTLPSGLHHVDEDVVHITHKFHHGISVFRRRATSEAGMRGFHLESLGILVAHSSHPRPWRHLASLKELSHKLADHWTSLQSQYSDTEENRDWTLLKEWYVRRMFRHIGEEGKWVDWEDELLFDSSDHPLLHLPHLLRLLGPSSLTLYKHVLARRRVLIYTNPAVELACILARIASDICGDSDRPNVLGMVGINDLDKLSADTWRGNGWIACTTDAIFLEKPSVYDLIVDMATSHPARPAFFVSRPAPETPRGLQHRLHPVHFTFSDIRLWSELERVLRIDSDQEGSLSDHKNRLLDGWRMYEDACLVCVGAWLGGWRGASNVAWGIATTSTSPLRGSIRLEGENGGIRNIGQGIEGCPQMTSDVDMCLPSQKTTPQVRTTLALLSIFHAHSAFLSERLSEVLDGAGSDPDSPTTLVLTLKDVMALELGVLSDLDASFLQWLAERNVKSGGRKIVIRRGWKDLLGVLLGFG